MGVGEEFGARIWRNMVVIAKSKNVNSDFGGQLGRRGLVIFVINVISSALILLISSGGGGGGGVVVVGAQQNLDQPQRAGPLSYADEEFHSSMYEERDASECNSCHPKRAAAFIKWLVGGYLHKNRLRIVSRITSQVQGPLQLHFTVAEGVSTNE